MARVQATNRVKIDNMTYTLKFDGTQRVALGTMGTLGSSLVGAVSVGGWIKTSSQLTTPQYVLGCSNSSGGNYFFVGMTRSAASVGKFNYQFRDASGRILAMQYSEAPVNTGRWVHFVWTKDATNTPGGVKLYINGVSKTITTVTNSGYADPANFDRAMAIGASLGSGAVASAWVGSISTPYIYTREITAQEASDWYYLKKVPTTPFAGYPNTEGSGTAVADVNATYNGTLTAAGQWSSTDLPYASRPVRSL